MDIRIQKLQTPEACERFIKNALRLGRKDLALEAQRRSIELRAKGHDVKTIAELESLQAIYAYEEFLTEKNGRRTRATRTWQMINKHGIIESVNRVVARPEDAMGFKILKEKGMEDLTFEAVVLKYPTVFSADAVEHARNRISKL